MMIAGISRYRTHQQVYPKVRSRPRGLSSWSAHTFLPRHPLSAPLYRLSTTQRCMCMGGVIGLIAKRKLCAGHSGSLEFSSLDQPTCLQRGDSVLLRCPSQKGSAGCASNNNFLPQTSLQLTAQHNALPPPPPEPRMK